MLLLLSLIFFVKINFTKNFVKKLIFTKNYLLFCNLQIFVFFSKINKWLTTTFLILLCHSSSSFPPEFSYTHVCPLICLAISHFCGRGWPLAASTTYSCYMLLKPEEGGYQCQMPCRHPWRHKLCSFSNAFLWLYYHHLFSFIILNQIIGIKFLFFQ